jgi:hypothetical protein
LDAVVAAREVDPDDAVPVLDREAGQVALGDVDAGAVDERVEAAVLSRIRAATAFTSSLRETSSGSAATPSPAASDSSPAASRSEAITVSPAAASARAVARPMPDAPPVIHTIRATSPGSSTITSWPACAYPRRSGR